MDCSDPLLQANWSVRPAITHPCHGQLAWGIGSEQSTTKVCIRHTKRLWKVSYVWNLDDSVHNKTGPEHVFVCSDCQPLETWCPANKWWASYSNSSPSARWWSWTDNSWSSRNATPSASCLGLSTWSVLLKCFSLHLYTCTCNACALAYGECQHLFLYVYPADMIYLYYFTHSVYNFFNLLTVGWIYRLFAWKRSF